MPHKITTNIILFLTVLLIGCWWGVGSVVAQEELPPPGSFIGVTGVNPGSAPSIELYLYGMDGNGQSLTLSAADLAVFHGGEPASEISVAGQTEALPNNALGTLTIFLLDLPPGVSESLPNVRAAIESYATSATMREEVDYVAIYQVGATEAVPLLEPAPFHNAVRNFFANPLPVEEGATALIDSMMSVLQNINGLKPQPGLVAHLVVMSDGTDIVSTKHKAEDVYTLAASAGIPIHTIWLENSDLNQPERGQLFMQGMASNTRGVAGNLADVQALTPLWQRIASFRPRTLVRYTIANPTGGQFPVVVNLTNEPEARTETNVTVPANAPSIVINLPPESRVLTLPNLDSPIRIRLSATASWLDGTERQLTRAQLLVNGVVVQELDSSRLTDFTVEISQFTFGNNSLQIVVEDEQGIRATSPNITLTIQEGEEALPEAIQPSGSLLGVLGWVLLLMVVIGLLVGAIWFVFSRREGVKLPASVTRYLPRIRLPRIPFLSRLRSLNTPRRRTRSTPMAVEEPESSVASAEVEAAEEDQRGAPYLEIIEAVTHLEQYFAIQNTETRLGRSPNQADLVFEQDVTVSRNHAMIVYNDGEFRIYDQQSSSGTWVNGQKVTSYGTPLLDGDEIRLGTARLVFHWH